MERTLASIRASDWPGAPVVLRQPVDWPVGWESTSRMYRTVLQRAWEDGCWWAVVLEDDVQVNRHLWANLTRWHPITTGQLHWGSLFIPDTIHDPWARTCPELGYRLARPALTTGPNAQWQKARLWGSQAYVFSRGGLSVMLDRWDRHGGGQDARAVAIAGGAGWPLWYASPCLVEHVPVISAFGTPPAYAPDFVPDFRFAPEPSGTYRHPEGIPGWLSFAEGQTLWELARDKRVLELGRFRGRSTVALAQSAREVVSVDVLDPAHAAGWLERFGCPPNVTLLQSRFAELDPRLNPFDLIFVDGERDAANVHADVELALARLAPGGCLACHGYPDPDWPDVRRVVDEVASARGLWRARQSDYLAVFRVSDAARPQEIPELTPLIAAPVSSPPTETIPTPRTVWVYWEGSMPGYIELCCETIRTHNRHIRVEVLDRAGFDALFLRDRDLPIDALILPHKADFIRAYLLVHYGGLYLDADCVVLNSLDFAFDLADTTGFVGYRDPLGYMSASFMVSAPGGAVIRDHYERVCAVLRSRHERGWLDLSSVPLDQAVTAHPERAHVLPTERIMPISWQASERLSERHPDAVHELSFRSDAAMYMLSNNTIKSRRATRVLAHMPAADLLADSYFLSFLFRRALGRPQLVPEIKYAYSTDRETEEFDEGALDFLAGRFGARTLIDVGCDSPETVYRAKHKGIRAVGVSGDPRVARDCQVIIEHDYTRKPLFAGEFDLGWSISFIKHIEERFAPNVMATFQDCRIVFVAGTGSAAERWIELLHQTGFALDTDATEGVRRHSTVEGGTTRTTGLVFRRGESTG
ncbi:class I SAM-dependent methyltransferase [Gemmata massiliana]|uniref:class I SAM-dependent methyltransferase n=1 Tax=Gemmata massiliana TaxID=1210884 RepID=UPI0013A70B9D|nr:class I SAM-dependent methyltransferase [Gemmata massiliana]